MPAHDGPWRRPAHAPPVPYVWRRFAGRAPAPGGTAPAFWIQDVSEDLIEEAVQHMCDHYLHEEQMSVAARHLEDPQAVEDFCGMWRRAMQEQRVSLAAFTLGADGRPQLVGCNVLGVQRRGEVKPEMRGWASRAVMAAVADLEGRADLWSCFPAAGACLTGLGLSVDRAFRGHGIGLQLLLARSELSAAVGLPFSATVFSGAASQKQSQRAGFRVLAELRYEDFRVDGRVAFPGTTWPCAHISVKSFEAAAAGDAE